jgi:hypothetical protein
MNDTLNTKKLLLVTNCCWKPPPEPPPPVGGAGAGVPLGGGTGGRLEVVVVVLERTGAPDGVGAGLETEGLGVLGMTSGLEEDTGTLVCKVTLEVLDDGGVVVVPRDTSVVPLVPVVGGSQHWEALVEPSSEKEPGTGHGVQESLPVDDLKVALGQISHMP